MQMRVKRTAAVALTLPLLLAACGRPTQAQHTSSMVPGALTADQTTAEFVTEAHTLPALPTGNAWPPANIPSADANGIEETYGPGLGSQLADSIWECMWISQVLSDKPGSPALVHDLTSLSAYRGTVIYRDQAVAREAFDPELQSAQLGDTGGLADDYAANCGS